MFVFLDVDVAVKSRVELVLELPTVDVFKNNIRLSCSGRVVRAEGATPNRTFGLAVAFDKVEIATLS